jgi:hypothetical protein
LRIFVIGLMITVLPFFNLSFSQEIDTLYLPVVYNQPGDSTSFSLMLSNNSFEVGGITIYLKLGDSTQVSFISAERGMDLYDFEYFYSNVTDGTILLTCIADMPNGEDSSPLPIGNNEIAVITIFVEEQAIPGSQVDILFASDSLHTNHITDSTGYLLINPVTVDGVVIFDQPVFIDDGGLLASTFSLGSNYPNPFNGTTSIGFELQKSGYVSLEVFDINGRLVTTLNDSFLEAGFYNFEWRSVSNSGEQLPSGVYFYRLTLDGKSLTKKMCMVK